MQGAWPEVISLQWRDIHPISLCAIKGPMWSWGTKNSSFSYLHLLCSWKPSNTGRSFMKRPLQDFVHSQWSHKWICRQSLPGVSATTHFISIVWWFLSTRKNALFIEITTQVWVQKLKIWNSTFKICIKIYATIYIFHHSLIRSSSWGEL